MAYTKNWHASPNFTPGSQTQAFYGRPRSISGGAGHWWNYPRLASSHDDIVRFMANPARQAAPHAVLSDRRVTEMVRDRDTAWCTGAANPYTFAIEVDPRIMYKWGYDNPSAAQRAHGERIFQTLCEYIADKGYHNLPWKPHNVWAPGTACNPIRYNEVMARAKQIVADRKKPASKPVPAAKPLSKPMKFTANLSPTSVWDLTTNPNYKAATTLKKGAEFVAVAYIDFNNNRYYVTEYSYKNGKKVGVNSKDLTEVKPVPEWQKNLKDITDAKLFVLPAAGTPVVNLNTGKVIPESVIAKGTAIDVAKQTTVGGKAYYLSQYAVKNAQPNGILVSDLGVPAQPPKQEKPEWLKNLDDITDVTMYTRAEVPLVNLMDGKTIKMLPVNTPVEIASATEVAGQEYFISKYATEKNQPNGILVAHLDKDPIKKPEAPIEPAPEQSLDTNAVVAFLEMLGKLITEFVNKLRGGK